MHDCDTLLPALIGAAVAAAKASDVAVLVLGDDTSTCGESRDVDDLDLPGSQLDLLQAVATRTSTPVVVVLVNCRPATFGSGGNSRFGTAPNALLDGVHALLVAWNCGSQGGNAVADLVRNFGAAHRTSPSTAPNMWRKFHFHVQPWARPRAQARKTAHGEKANALTMILRHIVRYQLFGAVSPSGRLAANWLNSAGAAGATSSTWGLARQQSDYDRTLEEGDPVAFPFGFGQCSPPPLSSRRQKCGTGSCSRAARGTVPSRT